MDVPIWRHRLLVASTLFGVLAALGAGVFAMFGAGIYGSSFGGGVHHNLTLLLVLLCGPLAVLPCVLMDRRIPGWGGIALCSMSLVEVGIVASYSVRSWGFAIHDAALGSLVLAAPMFLVGSLFLSSSPCKYKTMERVWWGHMAIATAICAYFVWMVGRDAVLIVCYFLTK